MIRHQDIYCLYSDHKSVMELLGRKEGFARQEEVAWTEDLLLSGIDEVV